MVALNRLYVRFSENSKIWRHEPLPVSKNNTRCVFKRQSMFVPLSLQNLSSSCHCPQVVRLSNDKKTHNFIHCYEKGPNNHRWPKLEIWALANIDIVAWQSKYKDLYWEIFYRFRNVGKWKDFNKKQLSLHKMCVTSLLCGPWADLWPFNGLYCKRFSLYVKVPVFFGVNSWFSRFFWLLLFDPCHSLHNSKSGDRPSNNTCQKKPD